MRLLAAVLVTAASASAQTTYTWQGGSGDWSQASGWSPSGVPGSGAGDGVIIPAGRVTLSAAPAHVLSSIAVTTGGSLALNGGGWTLPVSGAVVVGEGDGGTLTFDDDESPEGFITLSCQTLQVEREGLVSAVGTGYPGAPAGSGLAGSGPGAGGGAMGGMGYSAGGAGHGGYGVGGNGAPGAPYDDLFRPAAPGSGGGATLTSPAGGSGGGRIRVVASQGIDVQGRVLADGELAGTGAGSGSGGSLWLTTPQLTGSGQLSASGADGQAGSGGRVLIDALGSTTVAPTLRARGGRACCTLAAAGTIVLENAEHQRTLILDNTTGLDAWPTVLPPMLVTHLSVSNSIALWMPTDAELRVSADAVINANAAVAIAAPGGGGGGALLVRAGRLQLDGQIRGSGSGGFGAWQVAGGPAHAISPTDGGTTAGSHGGLGAGAAVGSTYGAAASPVELGSGGTADATRLGAGFRGSNGGGQVRLFAGSEVSINGAVLVSGQEVDALCPACAGGAGGSIWISAPVVSGVGLLDATGANGGGGGRIAVFADQFAFGGTLAGGSTTGIGGPGQPGTVVAPPSDALISLDEPPEGFFGDGQLEFSGFTLPPGAQFVVFVDDDQHLGDGSDTPNNPDLSEPMRRQTAAASPVTVTGLNAGHRYFWNVVALGADGGVLAGSALASFVACAGAGCSGPLPLDAGLTLPDGGIVEHGAPRFVSVPEGSASCGVPYAYSRDGAPQVVGAGPLHFTVEGTNGGALPSGVGVDAQTGRLQWTPSAAQEGVQRFDLKVTGPGGTARQPLDVIVVCRDAASPSVHCGCAQTGPGWVLLAGLLLDLRRRRVARLGKPRG